MWLVSKCIALAAAVAAMAAPTLAHADPLPIQMTQTSPLAFAAPVTVAWSFRNTTNAPMSGSFLFYLDSDLVSVANYLNNVTIARGSVKSGAFTFPVGGPGAHTLSVTFVNKIGVSTRGSPNIPTLIDPNDPRPRPQPAKPTGPNMQFLASGALKVQGSQPAEQIVGGALTQAQKNVLLQLYAPLMLFSYDHGSEERYAPIDVVDFIHQSTLRSSDPTIPGQSNGQLQTATSLLTPALSITSAQNPKQLPRNAVLVPSGAAQAGAPWSRVMDAARGGNPVGMYGHVTLETVQSVTDNVAPAAPAAATSVIQQDLIGRYDCLPAACTAQIVKIEYWQFFGYSHDFENPAAPFTNLLGPGTSAILADLIDHTGDWCTVQLYVDAGWAFSNQPDRAILAVYHSAHGVQFGYQLDQTSFSGIKSVGQYAIKELTGHNFGATVDMDIHAKQTDSAVQLAQNNVLQLAKDPASGLFLHPLVYVEWGGHEFYPTSSWSYKYASKHNGSGKYHYIASGVQNIGEIGQSGRTDTARLVTDFAGYWGNEGPNGQNGPPQGPTLHKQWFWDPNSPLTTLRSGIGMPF